MEREFTTTVGQRLRAFRERQGWSLRTLSERCGLSINAISRIERGENSPTITSLERLASALSIPITDFFVERSNRMAVYTPNGEGVKLQSGCSIIEDLMQDFQQRQLESFVITIQPNCNAKMDPVSHPGEEFVFCISGRVEFSVNDQTYLLNSGDCLLFQAFHAHAWHNPADEPAVILMVFQAAQDNLLAKQRHQIEL